MTPAAAVANSAIGLARGCTMCRTRDNFVTATSFGVAKTFNRVACAHSPVFLPPHFHGELSRSLLNFHATQIMLLLEGGVIRLRLNKIKMWSVPPLSTRSCRRQKNLETSLWRRSLQRQSID